MLVQDLQNDENEAHKFVAFERDVTMKELRTQNKTESTNVRDSQTIKIMHTKNT